MTDTTENDGIDVLHERGRARAAERARCLAILDALDPPVDPAAMALIRSGNSPTNFKGVDVLQAARAAADPPANARSTQATAAQPGATSGGKWGAITSRFNEQRKSASEAAAAAAKGPAT